MGKKSQFYTQTTNQRLPVELDVLDPINERGKSTGQTRFRLNTREREIAKKRKLAGKIAELLLIHGLEYTMYDAAEEMKVGVDEITPMFTETFVWEDENVRALKTAVIGRVTEMYLDLDKNWPTKQIADNIGISTIRFKKLVSSPEFESVYNDKFFKAVSDPRIKAVQEGINELAPLVYTTIKSLLTDKGTSDHVRIRAAVFLADRLGLAKQTSAQSDRVELAKFLGEHNIMVTNNTLNVQINNVTPEFQEEVDKYMPKEKTIPYPIDSEFEDRSSSSSNNK